MKIFNTTFFLLAFSSLSYGQYSVDTLEGNNVRATISNSGAFFNNPDLGKAGYESPKGGGNHLIYASAFWFGGMDDFGNLKVAADMYGLEGRRDTYPGALKADGSAEAPVEPYAADIYKVSKAEILVHASSYASWDYVAPSSITNWPAHGDVSMDMDFQLAPFADLNGNQIYEPESGEYPEIRGDHATYMIMNDRAGFHGMSGGDPLGIEIHYMFYQYDTDDIIDNTTFINVRVINRSSINYSEFIVGTFMDSDVGEGTDDFAGCSPENNFMFGYNGSNTDLGGSGQPGYGDNPPAVGFMMLNQPMNVSGYFVSGAGAYGDPNIAGDFWNYMNASWKNGTHFRYGGNGNTTASDVLTNYIYPSDPTLEEDGTEYWSEVIVDNPVGDRRVHMSTAPTSFAPGEVLCYDYAVMTSSRVGDHLENASNLFEQAPIIQDFYDNQPAYYCDWTLGTEELSKSMLLDVYPNPSNGTFNIQLEGEYTVEIFGLDGRQVYQSEILAGNATLQTDFAKGTYILVIRQDGSLYPTKIIIQ